MKRILISLVMLLCLNSAVYAEMQVSKEIIDSDVKLRVNVSDPEWCSDDCVLYSPSGSYNVFNPACQLETYFEVTTVVFDYITIICTRYDDYDEWQERFYYADIPLYVPPDPDPEPEVLENLSGLPVYAFFVGTAFSLLAGSLRYI